MGIAYLMHPVEIQACLLEPGKNSIGIPYIWHVVIIFAPSLKALFYITLNVGWIIPAFSVVELDNLFSPGS